MFIQISNLISYLHTDSQGCEKYVFFSNEYIIDSVIYIL